jgi:hypothetical protein
MQDDFQGSDKRACRDAKTLGLTFPLPPFARADVVIESITCVYWHFTDMPRFPKLSQLSGVKRKLDPDPPRAASGGLC